MLEDASLMGTYSPAPVRFVEGRGTVLVDDRGKQYLDFLGGIAVVSVGHANPVVAEAVARQAQRLCHVSNLFHNELAGPLAARLDGLVGDGRDLGGKVFFANSGAEANECALKLSRRYAGPGRHGVVTALGSFHGRTLATLAATGQPAKHEPFEPMPEGFRYVAYGTSTRWPRRPTLQWWGRCCSRPSRARAGSWSRRPATCARSGRCATSADLLLHGRRGPDRARANRALARRSSTRACCPMS